LFRSFTSVTNHSIKFQFRMFSAVERGSPYTPNHRVFYKNQEGKPISPLHDIPLWANAENNVFNMVVEIPRWTNAKMEICLAEPLNPIKQDVKKGNLRFVCNSFPHHGYIWNYGALPQTWENPNVLDTATGYKGDNDPIDVCEIGYRVAKRGDVVQVKVLGIMALIDEGETDWKVLAIDVNDPLAEKLNDVKDIEREMPGFIQATVEWFRIYKIPDGKPENQFAFNGEARDREYALNIIKEVHEHWKHLIQKQADAGSISCSNVTVSDSPYKVTAEDAEKILNESPNPGPPAELDNSVDKWYYTTK